MSWPHTAIEKCSAPSKNEQVSSWPPSVEQEAPSTMRHTLDTVLDVRCFDAPPRVSKLQYRTLYGVLSPRTLLPEDRKHISSHRIRQLLQSSFASTAQVFDVLRSNSNVKTFLVFMTFSKTWRCHLFESLVECVSAHSSLDSNVPVTRSPRTGTSTAVRQTAS